MKPIGTTSERAVAGISGGYLTLSMGPMFPDQVYDIDLYRCRTRVDVEEWVWHLREKSWFTRYHEEAMLTLLGAAPVRP